MAAFSLKEITARLESMKGWEYKSGCLEKEFIVPNFEAAVHAITRVSPKAEAMNHHPDILLHGYRNLRFTLTTHSAGGVTIKDFELAEYIDNLLV